jgi:hypothetical protein
MLKSHRQQRVLLLRKNTSMVRPKRKLVIKSPDLFPLTDIKIINMYGRGIINPKKFILLKITI